MEAFLNIQPPRPWGHVYIPISSSELKNGKSIVDLLYSLFPTFLFAWSQLVHFSTGITKGKQPLNLFDMFSNKSIWIRIIWKKNHLIADKDFVQNTCVNLIGITWISHYKKRYKIFTCFKFVRIFLGDAFLNFQILDIMCDYVLSGENQNFLSAL